MPPSRSEGEAPSKKARNRILNACHQCRRRKTKCSGSPPCTSCIENSLECLFDETQKRVMVSEKYLHMLESQLHGQAQVPTMRQTPQATGPIQPRLSERSEITPTSLLTASPQAVSSVRSDNVLGEDFIGAIQNPLTSPESFFLVDSSFRPRYLGSSSSIAFSWRVRSLLNSAIGRHVMFNLVPDSEEQTYSMASPAARKAALVTTAEQLPSLSTVKYLAETTIYHLGDLYHIFQRDLFMTQLEEFYGTSEHLQPPSNLWHVQLLLIIAFGKLFLGRGASAFGPPGAIDFCRAMQMQWDGLDMWSDPILRLEVLCLTTLYLNTCDMRASAYAFIGQAMRIALSLGMNRETIGSLGDETEYKRRRRIWWTIYVIDRKLSVTVGAPLAIRNEDIDVSLPQENDLGFTNSPLKMHIKLASLDGEVISSAYGIHTTVDASFVRGIQEVFASLHKMAEDLQGEFSIDPTDSRSVSRTVATLHIMHYQCIIIATRPILLVLFGLRLPPLLHQTTALEPISEPVMMLIKTCVSSAVRIVSILSALHTQELVDPFFMLDLQAVFSAGFILLLTSMACLSVTIDIESITKCEEILGWMSSKGNMPANSRLRDLAEMRAADSYIRSIRSTNVPLPVGTWEAQTDWNCSDSLLGGTGNSITTNTAFDGADWSVDATFWRDIITQMGGPGQIPTV